jgi:hypothetical protein
MVVKQLLGDYMKTHAVLPRAAAVIATPLAIPSGLATAAMCLLVIAAIAGGTTNAQTRRNNQRRAAAFAAAANKAWATFYPKFKAAVKTRDKARLSGISKILRTTRTTEGA